MAAGEYAFTETRSVPLVITIAAAGGDGRKR
jgi:hypothetical protein